MGCEYDKSASENGIKYALDGMSVCLKGCRVLDGGYRYNIMLILLALKRRIVKRQSISALRSFSGGSNNDSAVNELFSLAWYLLLPS